MGLIGQFAFFLCNAQTNREDIYTDYVLYPKRAALEKDLKERITGTYFRLPLDSNTEYKYESACEAISQFLFVSPVIESGMERLLQYYDSLEYDTRKSLLESIYAVYPSRFIREVNEVLEKETNPRLFSIGAVYLYRQDGSIEEGNFLKIRMVEKFPGYDTIPVLAELEQWLSYHTTMQTQKTPDIVALFRYQHSLGKKIIYSFQRWNRDYPGLAIVQNENGSFVRDASGKLLVVEQLARSGSSLPYFIQNGNTPQGVYSIQGTDIARSHFIGPTPNLQTILPFERKWDKYFQVSSWDSTQDSLKLYQQLLPSEWRNYAPMMEAWNAGKVGRSAIIAHGTTIDPEYFRGKSFYPLTPTEGCLCAKEIWNTTSGRLLVSEQFNLISAFQRTPGNKGYLIVINIDNQSAAVSRAEVEGWVKRFEKR